MQSACGQCTGDVVAARVMMAYNGVRLRPAIVTGNHRPAICREKSSVFSGAAHGLPGLGSSFAFAHRDGGRRPGGAAGAGEKVVGGQQTATLRRACIEVILR